MEYKKSPKQRAYARHYYHNKRGNPTDPPPGFVRLSEVANLLGITQVVAHLRAKAGHYGEVWQRAPHCALYVDRKRAEEARQ